FLSSAGCAGVRGAGQRQGECEFAAPSRRAFDFHLAAMRVRDMSNQRQAEPAAFRVVNERIAGAIKLLEDARLFVPVDADAAVGDLQLMHALLAIELHSQELSVV